MKTLYQDPVRVQNALAFADISVAVEPVLIAQGIMVGEPGCEELALSLEDAVLLEQALQRAILRARAYREINEG